MVSNAGTSTAPVEKPATTGTAVAAGGTTTAGGGRGTGPADTNTANTSAPGSQPATDKAPLPPSGFGPRRSSSSS